MSVEIYEYTFPDCPTCGNMKNGDCEFKSSCIVGLSEDGEYRVGTPSKYIASYYQEFLKLGYSKIEAEELAVLVERCDVELPEVNPEDLIRIVDKFDAIPLVNPIFEEELRKIL